MTLMADVVIIGGGVTGTSTAFHLTQRGVRDVIVVDKSFVASGGTGKSSACVRQHYSTPETCRMIRFRPRLLPALRGADRRPLMRVPAHRLPARRGREDAKAHGSLGGAPARHRHRDEAGLAPRDAGDRAQAPHRGPGGRLLRARLRLLQSRRDRPGLRAGGSRARRAHPGGGGGAVRADRRRPCDRREHDAGPDPGAARGQCGGPLGGAHRRHDGDRDSHHRVPAQDQHRHLARGVPRDRTRWSTTS